MLPSLQAVGELLRGASRVELLPRFAEVSRDVKHDGSIVTAADHAMQQHLQRALTKRWPQYGFIGEEMPRAEQEALLARDGGGFWCLDPLDGTSNFAAGVPLFGVSLALVMEGGVELAWICDPVRDECFCARRGQGAWLNGGALELAGQFAPDALARCLAVVDLKRLAPDLAARIAAKPPFGSQRNFGSCSLEWCWLAAGRVHLYLHGGQKLWDYAAGELILREAGGSACTLEGESLYRRSLAPRSALAAMNAALHDQWRAWLESAE